VLENQGNITGAAMQTPRPGRVIRDQAIPLQNSPMTQFPESGHYLKPSGARTATSGEPVAVERMAGAIGRARSDVVKNMAIGIGHHAGGLEIGLCVHGSGMLWKCLY
jgi:hypothetical protein